MSTTDLSTPMELFGAHPGISVIDPATVLTRLWYFDGKFLRAEGFRRDQEYVRSLVALSNQAFGHGLVHGFDVALGGSDRFRIEGGLAVAPSGKVIYLPQQIELSIAELIARSAGDFDPGAAPGGGVADFSPCPPDTPLDPVTGLTGRPYYVLTVAPTEALCGEEERFGQLCEDACATETDRSVAVEGTRYRVRQLHLALPTSRLVPFTPVHHRSQIATAYYEEERKAVPSMISGAGLRTPVWCRSAEGINGDEVALAVFDRSGAVTSWVDMWIARRELVETTPQRYWGWRMAQRPLDVFLAQVLQFQCQLIACGGDGLDPGADPCADERAALDEVSSVLSSLMDAEVESGFTLSGDFGGGEPIRAIDAAQPKRMGFDRLHELQERVKYVLAGGVRSATGSRLIDCGLVTTPPFFYLPTDPDADIEAQVRAMLGPGVDPRFCAVRPDFVPEAFFEAQHMDRISLTQGIDDPGMPEQVDVLVPNGQFLQTEAEIEGFTGVVRILPARRKGSDATKRDDDGAALSLAAVARDHVREGWSWSLAGHAEVPHQLGVSDLAMGLAVDLGAVKTEAAAESYEMHVEEAAEADALMAEAEILYRANAAKAHARERVMMTNVGVAYVPDEAIAPDVRRPFSLWFDVQTDRDLREVPKGSSTFASGRVSVYSRAKTNPVVVDLQFSGSLAVTGRQASGMTADGHQIETIATTVTGSVDPLMIVGSFVHDPPAKSGAAVDLVWKVGVTPQGLRVLSVQMNAGEGFAIGQFEDSGTVRHVDGVIDFRRFGHSVSLAGDWTPIESDATDGTTLLRLASLELDEDANALSIGSPGRELGESVIEVIGAELALRGRDSQFTPTALARLFEPDRPASSTLSTTADWVAVHRRRVKSCGEATPAPAAVRRLRWFHAVVESDAVLEKYARLRGGWTGADAGDDAATRRVFARLDRLGFELVTTVEYPEQSTAPSSSIVALRAAWSAGDRGDRLVLGVSATHPTGDGLAVAKGRLTSAVAAVADLVDTRVL